MGALDLNRVAVVMGKVYKLLNKLEPTINNGNDVYGAKDELCYIAYMCRVGIIDRIETNSYLNNPSLAIRIPTGIFTSRKETMYTSLDITVERLKRIVSKDVVTTEYINQILEKGPFFYSFQNCIPENARKV